jgi:hypothetical protein
MRRLARNVDTATLNLAEEAGHIVQRATLPLRDLFAAWPEREQLASLLVKPGTVNSVGNHNHYSLLRSIDPPSR